jgi:hypothetical protein
MFLMVLIWLRVLVNPECMFILCVMQTLPNYLGNCLLYKKAVLWAR